MPVLSSVKYSYRLSNRWYQQTLPERTTFTIKHTVKTTNIYTVSKLSITNRIDYLITIYLT